MKNARTNRKETSTLTSELKVKVIGPTIGESISTYKSDTNNMIGNHADQVLHTLVHISIPLACNPIPQTCDRTGDTFLTSPNILPIPSKKHRPHYAQSKWQKSKVKQ